MSLGAKYTTYEQDNFTAALALLHSYLSESPLDDATPEDRIRSTEVLYAITDRLGAPIGAAEAEERIMMLRESSLSHGESLNRIWRELFGNRQPEQSNVTYIADSIVAKLHDDRPRVEVTDQMVNSIALAAFGPSVVYNREAMRLAIEEALNA